MANSEKKSPIDLARLDGDEQQEIALGAFAIHHMICMKRLQEREEENRETTPQKNKPTLKKSEELDGCEEEKEEEPEETPEKRKPRSRRDDEKEAHVGSEGGADGASKKKSRNVLDKKRGEPDELDDSKEEKGGGDEETPKKRKRSSKREEEINEYDGSEGEAKGAGKKKKKKQKPRSVLVKKREEPDDSDETLILLFQYNPPEIPPAALFGGDDVVGEFSRPFWKQLTKSDTTETQSRLTLGKLFVLNTLIPLLEDSEKPDLEGTEVSAFGPNGKVYKMMFKKWAREKVYVLTTGWKDFFLEHGLQKHSDFVTLWMFRHKKTQKICFAITFQRFPVQRHLSSRIMKAVFSRFN